MAAAAITAPKSGGQLFLAGKPNFMETVIADEAYIRESILMPSAKITAGFQPIMPAFQGLVTEEQLLELIEYVKSLQTQPQTINK